jgi:hypothetical protein
MSFEVTSKQALFLWRLLLNDGQAWLSELSPKLTALERQQLQEAGLLLEMKLRTPRNREALYVHLADEAWHWAVEHLDSALPLKGPQAAPLLRAFLGKLRHYLRRQSISLADILQAEAEESWDSEEDQEPALLLRVFAAYARLSHGKVNAPARLADLRQSLDDVPRHELDALLMQLHIEQRLRGIPVETGKEASVEDAQAALVIAGQVCHYVSIETWG